MKPLRGKSKLFGFNGQLHLFHPPRRGSLREFPAEEDDSPGQRGGGQKQEGTEAKHLGMDCLDLLRESVASR